MLDGVNDTDDLTADELEQLRERMNGPLESGTELQVSGG